MAAYLLIHMRGILKCLHVDSQKHQHFITNNNGPNGHLFYVGGDLMTRRGMLPIIMLPDGDLCIMLRLVPFWILAGNISLRRVLETNPGRSHGSADTLPLRHSANFRPYSV